MDAPGDALFLLIRQMVQSIERSAEQRFRHHAPVNRFAVSPGEQLQHEVATVSARALMGFLAAFRSLVNDGTSTGRAYGSAADGAAQIHGRCPK